MSSRYIIAFDGIAEKGSPSLHHRYCQLFNRKRTSAVDRIDAE